MQKLFTRRWIGVLTILLLFIIIEILLFANGFQNGFINFPFLSKFILSFVFIGFFVIAYTNFETPTIPTIGGLLGLFLSNSVVGIDWLILLILGLILFFPLFYFAEPILNKPIPQEPYIVSDPTKPLQVNIENAIRRFTPSRRYRLEIDYQNELYSWLSREFPVQYEVQKGSSRPDLIIKNIAIEIKGPTGNGELNTLTTKFLKYSNHYPYFIIVLFDCNFSEGHFNEISGGIRKFAPHVIIIRK